MILSPWPVTSPVGAFLLAFPALFSIVNPVGTALIFDEVTRARTRPERLALSWRIACYSLLILLGSLLLGSYILAFFGISLGALRVAGGAVVAFSAWGLLMNPQANEDHKTDDAASEADVSDMAFFPLTMPFTTGPGSIAVAIALASERPPSGRGLLPFFTGVCLAAALVCVLVWLSYRWSDRVLSFLGRAGTRVMSRMVAFLLLCIGVQIISTGMDSLLAALIHPA